MKKLSLLLLTLLVVSATYAQTAAPEEKSDPAAKKILDKIRKKYEGYKTLEVSFSLETEVPRQAKEVQKGKIGQDGDTKFRLDMKEQVIVSDGKTTWAYLKKDNEVQINDADPKGLSTEGFFTPKELLRRYQKGDFIYAITDKVTENGKVITQIEFKPKDRKSEFAKFRLNVDATKNTIESFKAFGKDSSRFTFTITGLSPNKKFSADHFTFDAKQYPGVRVEDLRM